MRLTRRYLSARGLLLARGLDTIDGRLSIMQCNPSIDEGIRERRHGSPRRLKHPAKHIRDDACVFMA